MLQRNGEWIVDNGNKRIFLECSCKCHYSVTFNDIIMYSKVFTRLQSLCCGKMSFFDKFILLHNVLSGYWTRNICNVLSKLVILHNITVQNIPICCCGLDFKNLKVWILILHFIWQLIIKLFSEFRDTWCGEKFI